MSEIGSWLNQNWNEDAIVARFTRIVSKDADVTTAIQATLSRTLMVDDGHVLSGEIVYLDACLYFIGSKLGDAEALLDVAEGFYRIPAGRSVPCTTEEGELIPATGSRGKKRADGDDDFMPKYKELTDADRNVELAAKVAPFRRLRDEFKHLHGGLIGRLFRAKDIMAGIVAEASAAGIANNAGRAQERPPDHSDDRRGGRPPGRESQRDLVDDAEGWT